MKQYLQKFKKTIEDNILTIEILGFLITLSAILHILKFPAFTTDLIWAEFVFLGAVMMILNIYQEEKEKKKMVLKIIGLILLFSAIIFQIMFDHIFGPNFTCPRCDWFFEAILK